MQSIEWQEGQLSLVVILSSASFSIDLDILDFLPSWSYTVFPPFALLSGETLDTPRTESSSVVSQGYCVLVLSSLGHNLPRLGPLDSNE